MSRVSRPAIGSADRLGATLAFSVIAHGVLILGLGFTLDAAAPMVPTLDVILVQTHSEAAPETADFLAQANQQGGGDRDEARRPREAQPALIPKPEPGIVPQPLQAQAPPPEPQAAPRFVATTRADRAVAAPEEAQPTTVEPLPSGRQLMQQSLEMARLAAEIERQQELYAKKPKRKFVSASTREYEYAAYLRAWVLRVERIGNLNYPDEARRRGLSGRLIMNVSIRRDGSVADMTITESSGHRVLDEAAMRTVRLAAPFAPLPKTTENIDILDITRTWQFLPGGTMRNE